jgi:DNA-binding MarR family transcriptional regulator
MPDDALRDIGADHWERPLLGLLLRLLNQRWGDDVDTALNAAGFGGIRPPHAMVFPFVPDEGIQVGELARLAHMRKQSMAEAVYQLETLGYAERRPDPNDRRAKLVFLTARGKAVRPAGVTAGRGVEQRWARLTSERQVETLRRSLIRLLAALDEDAGRPRSPISTNTARHATRTP